MSRVEMPGGGKDPGLSRQEAKRVEESRGSPCLALDGSALEKPPTQQA